ncbi:protein-L-isoaspartate(D-aspartate) O-methyltransferase [Rhizobium sp. SG_E_25_P2]|uniref:protein-L-isoaspartate O-methyltransferase family protein n=1 Tax=Rhizobium sp. SG_E_25_P2 TaxID=2879942 RepID=UPI0024757ED4|nr:protein-L-isoaspartate O-methyltransferase [Rhizobium sp. SG_E_25_P2]MDH6268647.1 protein-L-isoaspartate(D-aspartate) O-methyltransferase [Rhizobium sp. SG_E_25_P2]
MDYAAQRAKMVDNQIRTTDVTSRTVLAAFLAVPREKFTPEHLKALSYIDTDINVGEGRYMMEPSPLAKMLQLLDLRAGERVLEIGAASGYSAALMAHMGASVVTVEETPAAAEFAKAALDGVDNVTLVTGALSVGCPAKGPYDAIFVNGAVEELPQSLFDQLKEGGRLVAVFGEGLASSAKVFVSEGRAVSERFGFNTSVRKLPGFEKIAEFVF